MAIPYTRRLIAAQFTTTGTQTIFTADAAFHYVVRDIVVTNGDLGPHDDQVYIRLPNGENVNLLLLEQMPAASTVHWDGRQALEPGDELRFVRGGPFQAIAVTGYVLFN